MSLNTPHKVTLTESQISIILYTLEGYMSGDTSNDPDLPTEVDAIFEELDEIFEVFETTVDKFYNKIEKARAKQPEGEW